MKRVVLIMATAFALSACGGGGGGGAAPSVNLDSPPPEETRRLTPAEQAEVRTAADALLNDLDGLENNAEANSLRQEIDALIADINAARHTIEELQNEIAELRMEVKTLKEKPPSPPDETTTPPPDETTTPPPDETMTPPPDETMTPPDETTTPPPDETITPSVYDTAEFRGNYALARMGALHAYNSGYHGQSVTVMVPESDVRHTHTALSPNIITLSGAIGNLWDTPKSDRLLRHGTNVAGILGAAREIGEMHGVAPSVKMVFPADDLDYAPNNDIPIISNSSGAAFSGITELDDLAVITTSGTVLGTFNEWANRRNRQLGNSDTIWVNSNGNDGWNTLHSTLNVPNFEGLLPLVHQRMADNIIVVGNLNTLTLAAGRTNGCGVAMMWCVFAFGVDHRTTDSDSDTDYTRATLFTGTSAAAPHVAGALAVLKSAAPELPMTMIRQILLTTATDLGEEGIDEVYGWGLVNISAGIDHIENLEMANGMAYSDLRKSLPSEFSHLRGRMESVSVALRITDRSYYNMRLSDIVGGGDSQKTSLGNAAKEMQADDSLSPENSGFGFNYANGDYDLHYAGGGNENAFRFSGGLRHDDSQSSYIGEGGGIFSAENASDTGGYVKWTTKNYGGISAFGEYGRTQIKADYDSASFISQIQNARAEEWTAGFQYQNLFLHNDSLRFSARQESRISGGEMVLHYPIADGDSHKAFIGESVQTIRTETAKIPIKQKPQTIYTAGYSQKTENSKWSAAAEWNSATNAKGFSFAIELQIR